MWYFIDLLFLLIIFRINVLKKKLCFKINFKIEFFLNEMNKKTFYRKFNKFSFLITNISIL